MDVARGTVKWQWTGDGPGAARGVNGLSSVAKTRVALPRLRPSGLSERSTRWSETLNIAINVAAFPEHFPQEAIAAIFAAAPGVVRKPGVQLNEAAYDVARRLGAACTLYLAVLPAAEPAVPGPSTIREAYWPNEAVKR